MTTLAQALVGGNRPGRPDPNRSLLGKITAITPAGVATVQIDNAHAGGNSLTAHALVAMPVVNDRVLVLITSAGTYCLKIAR